MKRENILAGIIIFILITSTTHFVEGNKTEPTEEVYSSFLDVDEEFEEKIDLVDYETTLPDKSNIKMLGRNQLWHWALNAGGGSVDYGYDIAIDSVGNVYVTGVFYGTASFGNITLTSEGGYDVFIVKLDSNGDWLWAKSAGGSVTDSGYGIAIDSSDNVYITGYFEGPAYFGSITLHDKGAKDVYVAKLDSNDDWQWAVSDGGTNYDIGWGIDLDSSGNIYIVGYFSGTTSFGGINLTSNGEEDVYVAKLDSNGDWQWAISAGGPNQDLTNRVALDQNNNIYICGNFENSISFGNINLTAYGKKDVFVAKLDTDGILKWITSGGGEKYDHGRSVKVDSNGNIIVGGYVESSAFFGNFTIGGHGGIDAFIAKLDSNGDWLWAKSAGGANDDRGYGVAVDLNDNAYLTGRFRTTAYFGNMNITSNGDHDVFIAMLNSNGEWQWANGGGGGNWDEGRSVAVDQYSNKYHTGFFRGTAIFGNYTLVSQGDHDIFIAKISEIIENLECGGTLNWNDVEPGAIVTGTITVENIGDIGSVLDWEIDTYPSWGIWSFDPFNGTDLLAGDSIEIDVEVVAPNEQEETFTGEVILVNSEDPEDTCSIDVSLATPVIKSTQYSFLQLFIERFPKIFFIVRNILGF